MNLLRQYWRGGVLFHAFCQFLLTGISKTGLEILRCSVDLKMKQRLKKRYGSVIKDFVSKNASDLNHNQNKTIWIFWWQGMGSAPNIVKVCHKSIYSHLSDWKIVLLTEQNYLDYISIPDFIMKKKDKGIISLAHFADILRLELLIKYGGLWIDSTVFCTSGNMPQSIIQSDLFVFQTQKPGADGKPTLMSNWLIYAKANHIILRLTLQLIYKYWERNDFLVDYFFFHKFFSIACEVYPQEAKKIPSFDNSVPHILLLHLFDKYDEKYWNDLKQMTCFHKLSYKLDEEKCKEEGTYYDEIINQGL